ncbi:MAG: class I SAM-dependent methyltransferase [Henriciella sp.]|nr:class I SAM-dependent methyltransferase [Henriciella sp.]
MTEPDAQYSDPRLAAIYDLGNAGTEDRDFYLALAGPPPQDILDLGCGTGLITDRFAALGHRVVGVDPAAAMLSVARQKPNGATIDWVLSTSEDFNIDRSFDLIIMTGHAFQVLLSDNQISSTLAVMARHLKPDGQAVFESRNPAINWDAVWARTYTMQTASGPIKAERRMTDRAPSSECLSFAWDYHFPDEVLTSHSTLRFATHTHITAVAAEAGLELSHLLGDWDGSAFHPTRSREMIFKFRLIE